MTGYAELAGDVHGAMAIEAENPLGACEPAPRTGSMNSGEPGPPPHKAAGTRARILRNFMVMALCFSLNHGTVTALIALAGSELGPSLGSSSLAVLYVVYTFTAAFLSHAVVAALGAKRAIFAGLATYCGYVVSYLIAYFVPAVTRPAIFIGAVCGGAAAGFLWPAQGAYYAKSAEAYAAADETFMSREQANSLFGSYFSTCYLACEVVMKLTSSLLPLAVGKDAATKTLYVVYTAVAFGSAAAVLGVDEVAADARPLSLGKTAASAFSLLIKDPKCACMIPMNFAFGFCAAYLNGYFFSSVVGPSVGKDKIGYMSSLVVGSAALVALPFGRVGKVLGQAPIVAFGGLCFGAFGVANLASTPAALGHWAALLPLAIVFGCGRSIWETNFKATFADYFPKDVEAAFANVQLQSGVASTIGFFVIPRITPTALGWIAVVCAVLAVLFQFVAAALYRREKNLEDPAMV